MFAILLGAIALLCGLYLYARYIEPARLIVERVTVTSPKLGDSLTIALLSDLHIGAGGMDVGRVQKIMSAVAGQQPDAVVFVGDLFDKTFKSAGDMAALTAALSLSALPHVPKYAVYGNNDLGTAARAAFRAVMEGAGWHILVNRRVCLGAINLMGSDDALLGHPAIEPLIDSAAFNLLLVHEPDIASGLTGVDLQLSGHTHGGQVRLPLLGALVLPRQGKRYVRGLYNKPGGGQVYVSTGLGMSTLPFRFGVPPRLDVLQLRGVS